jgi:flagellar motor switch protein FliN/FliY
MDAGSSTAGGWAEGLRPTFIAAAAAFGVPDSALDGYGAGPVEADDDARGVLLFDGDVHRATVALVVTSGVPAVAEHEFSPLPGAGALPGTAAGRAVAGGPIELLHEVEMGVTVELGRTRMLVRDILDLSPGSVIELDRAAGAPIDVLVNGTLIARGEVVVIDEEFGIRITEVIGYESR